MPSPSSPAAGMCPGRAEHGSPGWWRIVDPAAGGTGTGCSGCPEQHWDPPAPLGSLGPPWGYFGSHQSLPWGSSPSKWGSAPWMLPTSTRVSPCCILHLSTAPSFSSPRAAAPLEMGIPNGIPKWDPTRAPARDGALTMRSSLKPALPASGESIPNYLMVKRGPAGVYSSACKAFVFPRTQTNCRAVSEPVV